jgi:hypothetical protein
MVFGEVVVEVVLKRSEAAAKRIDRADRSATVLSGKVNRYCPSPIRAC